MKKQGHITSQASAEHYLDVFLKRLYAGASGHKFSDPEIDLVASWLDRNTNSGQISDPRILIVYELDSDVTWQEFANKLEEQKAEYLKRKVEAKEAAAAGQ